MVENYSIDLVFTEISPRDILDIYFMGRETFVSVGIKDEWTLTMLSSVIENYSEFGIVVKIGKKLVAFSLGSEMNDRDFYVYWMAVAPEHQHRGIGKKMLSMMIRKAIDNGYGRVVIDADPENETVKIVLERIGFEEVGKLTYYAKKIEN